MIDKNLREIDCICGGTIKLTERMGLCESCDTVAIIYRYDQESAKCVCKFTLNNQQLLDEITYCPSCNRELELIPEEYVDSVSVQKSQQDKAEYPFFLIFSLSIFGVALIIYYFQ